MPVLRSIRERFAARRPLEGVRIAACLHVTTETANLLRTLLAGGADAGLCASNPLTTQDDVAAALVERYGAEVHAIAGEDTDTYYRHIEALADRRPQITMDDGADLISVIHGRRTDLIEGIVGATEETTTGVIRIRALEAQGKLGFPVVAGNAAPSRNYAVSRFRRRRFALVFADTRPFRAGGFQGTVRFRVTFGLVRKFTQPLAEAGPVP